MQIDDRKIVGLNFKKAFLTNDSKEQRPSRCLPKKQSLAAVVLAGTPVPVCASVQVECGRKSINVCGHRPFCDAGWP